MEPPVIREQVLLARYTTLGLGGAARFFIDCENEDDIREGITIAREKHCPLLVLGGGSNMVVCDDGFPGVVAHIVSRGITFIPRGYRCHVHVAAGELWDDVVLACVNRGLGGLECLSGIPGTTGATPVQNVGAYGQEVGEAISWVHVIDRDTLKEEKFPAQECSFQYRSSRFKGPDVERFVITAVEFDLPVTSHAVIRYPELARAIERDATHGPDGHQTTPLARARETVLRLRSAKGMVVSPTDPESRSAGSFFTNPVMEQQAFAAVQERWRAAGNAGEVPSYPAESGVKIPAAWLVEHAGFPRGTRRGSVGVSSKHALALVNYGGSASALLDFAGEIKAGVAAKFGITLAMEPVIVSHRSAT